MRTEKNLRIGVLGLIVFGIYACGDDDPDRSGLGPGPANAGVQRVISQVESLDAGVLATLRSGAAPASSGGPSLDTATAGSVVNGGSSVVELQATGPAKRAYVWVRPTGSTVLDGYWEFELPTPRTNILIQVTIAQAADQVTTTFDCIYALADEAGRIGPPTAASIRIVPVGTGDVQVSISWDTPSDVDLHVVEPSGEEIYYGDRNSATGGQLDLDSNAACGIDGVNNENVTWPSGSAPRGMYTVRVDYWSSCSQSETNYVVTVQRGGAPETFRGTLTGSGTRGGLGSGTTVAQFNY